MEKDLKELWEACASIAHNKYETLWCINGGLFYYSHHWVDHLKVKTDFKEFYKDFKKRVDTMKIHLPHNDNSLILQSILNNTNFEAKDVLIFIPSCSYINLAQRLTSKSQELYPIFLEVEIEIKVIDKNEPIYKECIAEEDICNFYTKYELLENYVEFKGDLNA